MLRTVPLSIIRSFSLYTLYTFRPDPARKLSANLYDIYHCGVYSEKLLMMDRGTVRNIEFYSKNKFEKLVSASSWFYYKNKLNEFNYCYTVTRVTLYIRIHLRADYHRNSTL